jgi:hypothetical protein
MRGFLLLLALGSIGCASTRPTVVASTAPVPLSMPKLGGPAIESADYSIQLYSHPSVDPDNSLPTAGGIIKIRAPMEKAFEAASDFKNIYQLNPYIETSKVVNIEGDATDVYIRVPTVINIDVWAVVRFRPIRTNDGGWACQGKMIDGNLDDLRIFWRLVPAGPNETLGQFELLADPALPLPRSWVLRDTKDGVHIMLERFRYKVEARSHSPDDEGE